VEKMVEWFFAHEQQPIAAEKSSESEEIVDKESDKIKSAIRTDFILSIEIIVIALGTVLEESLPVQVLVVGTIATLATIAVYGFVALLVRMDDTGINLIEKAKSRDETTAKIMTITGKRLLASLPKIITILGVVGTIAMLLVGGGMFVHNIETIHHVLEFMPSIMPDLIAGLAVGLPIVGLVKLKAAF